jgi:hypothetical protein
MNSSPILKTGVVKPIVFLSGLYSKVQISTVNTVPKRRKSSIGQMQEIKINLGNQVHRPRDETCYANDMDER